MEHIAQFQNVIAGNHFDHSSSEQQEKSKQNPLFALVRVHIRPARRVNTRPQPPQSARANNALALAFARTKPQRISTLGVSGNPRKAVLIAPNQIFPLVPISPKQNQKSEPLQLLIETKTYFKIITIPRNIRSY